MIKGLDEWRSQNNMPPSEPTASKPRKVRVLRQNQQAQQLHQQPVDPTEAIPMMYRAQVQGRCNLQYAGGNNLQGSDLEKWKTEWVRPQRNQEPSYQYQYDDLDSDHPGQSVHSFQIEFPYRVFTNSGQDSILRPVLDVYGIPFIPGSSVKGFLRRCLYSAQFDDQQKETIKQYCGDVENPGTLRFHGAYPIGNWANRMIDVVHPQQERQVQKNARTSASALISFYQPKFVFEFSSAKLDIDWQALEQIIRQALQNGLGGKTSTGYGFASPPAYADFKQADQEAYKVAKHIRFEGKGVSSVLLSGQPEFRPNLFKANLRGHLYRLLAGVCDSELVVKREVNRLLGGTDTEGVIQLFWDDQGTQLNLQQQSAIYEAKGTLHLAASVRAQLQDLQFAKDVLKFAYVMGGFGKSWRRVWHKDFYNPVYDQNYPRLIGCHWKATEFNDIETTQDLKEVLENLNQTCRDRLGSNPLRSLTWREAWHLERVAVYSKIVSQSQAIRLFHDETFKTTPAIGGKKPGDLRPKFVSSVWHRMLPIENNQYLEIVTVFHGDRTPWVDQLQHFVQAVKNAGLEHTWGTEPTP